MNSIAAFYAFTAMTAAQQDAERRRAEFARGPRPSILARARMFLAPSRPARQPEPASTPA